MFLSLVSINDLHSLHIKHPLVRTPNAQVLFQDISVLSRLHHCKVYNLNAPACILQEDPKQAVFAANVLYQPLLQPPLIEMHWLSMDGGGIPKVCTDCGYFCQLLTLAITSLIGVEMNGLRLDLWALSPTFSDVEFVNTSSDTVR